MFTAGVRADDQVYVHRRLSDQELLYFFGWIYFSVKKKQTNKTSEVKRSKVVLVASFSSIEKRDRTLGKKKSGGKSLSKEEEV